MKRNSNPFALTRQMTGKPDPRLGPKKKPPSGFSLTEVMVSMAIGSLVVAIISVNLPAFERMSRTWTRQTLFESSYLIFLLKLEEDYQEAEIDESGTGGDLDKMFFYKDLNRDGDYNDEVERIEYRCDEPNQQIDRMSRRKDTSKFQAVLDEIAECAWEIIPVQDNNAETVCHQFRIKLSLGGGERTIKYCRAH